MVECLLYPLSQLLLLAIPELGWMKQKDKAGGTDGGCGGKANVVVSIKMA